jgi:hypothetical protein
MLINTKIGGGWMLSLLSGAGAKSCRKIFPVQKFGLEGFESKCLLQFKGCTLALVPAEAVELLKGSIAAFAGVHGVAL